MNKVILCGRLTRDPEVRYSSGERQMAVAHFTLAVDRRGRRNEQGGTGEQTADFPSCVAFDRTAEFAEKYLRQGTKVIVTGRLQTGSYTNRDGQRVYTTDVIVEDLEFAESKNTQDGNQFQVQIPAAPKGNGGNAGFSGSFKANAPDPGDGFMTIPDGVNDEGLPFN